MENGMNYLIHLERDMQGSDSLFNRVTGGTPVFKDNVDPELDHKSRKVSEKFSESLHIIANEPSLAFFRIQEHVRKTLPQLVEQKHEVQEIQQNVQGACFDTEYATNTVKSMQTSSIHFQNIQDLLKNAMFMKQQIEYEESRKHQEKHHRSMYSAGRDPSSGALMNTSCTDSENSMTHSGNAQSGEDVKEVVPDDVT